MMDEDEEGSEGQGDEVEDEQASEVEAKRGGEDGVISGGG
jgi:hypothetical protein